jgi:hypothetical protein
LSPKSFGGSINKVWNTQGPCHGFPMQIFQLKV